MAEGEDRALVKSPQLSENTQCEENALVSESDGISQQAIDKIGSEVDQQANGMSDVQEGSSQLRKSGRLRKDKSATDLQVPRSTGRIRAAVRLGKAVHDFSCDLCESSFVINPRRRSGRAPKQRATPRHQIDPVTKRRLNLCNACGLTSRAARRGDCSSASKRKNKIQERGGASDEDKQRYLNEANRFTFNLVNEYNDADAERLFCPQFKQRACCCIQRYIGAEGDAEESRKRALLLLQLIKEAKRLSRQKCYNVNEIKALHCGSNRGRGNRSVVARSPHPIGLGNGQKKSKMFEEFVLENRSYLRGTLKFCERGTQKILVYSNNFLHKKLKTVPERASRVKRQKGKAALGLLLPIEQLNKQQCCGEKCVTLAVTHSRLLLSWRERVAAGQAEARRVLAEMLTPSGGARSNCYKFITMVTGCSNSTICRVSEQMKLTGGDREPPEHGLKKWWEENPRAHARPGAENGDCSEQPDSPMIAVNECIIVSQSKHSVELEATRGKSESYREASVADPQAENATLEKVLSVTSSMEALSQLQLQHKHIVNLQNQLAKQQMALQQEQQMIELQLKQQCGILQVPSPLPTAKRPQAISVATIHPSNAIVDVPCLQSGRTVSYTLALSDPSMGNLLSNSDLAASSSSNLNITILPQHVSDLDNRPECLSSISSANGTLNNFVLIQSPSGSIIDSIPLVMDTDYQTSCPNHSYSLITDASTISLNASSIGVLQNTANGNGLLHAINQPAELTSEDCSINGNRSLLRSVLQQQQSSNENFMPRSSILDLTTIGKPK